jgi:hypothetical protein
MFSREQQTAHASPWRASPSGIDTPVVLHLLQQHEAGCAWKSLTDKAMLRFAAADFHMLSASEDTC